MYMARIEGWYEVIAFSNSLEKAKKLAINQKKKICKDENIKWDWDSIQSFYGAFVEEIKEGTIIEL